jgi:hypothetical protein
LPKGFLIFEKPAKFRLLASVNGGSEIELLTKEILYVSKSDSTALQRLVSQLKPAVPSTKT